MRLIAYSVLSLLLCLCGCAQQEVRPLATQPITPIEPEQPVKLEVYNVSGSASGCHIDFTTSDNVSVIYLHAAECYPHEYCYHKQRDGQIISLNDNQHQIKLEHLYEGDYVVLTVSGRTGRSNSKAVFQMRDGHLQYLIPGWAEPDHLLGAK